MFGKKAQISMEFLLFIGVGLIVGLVFMAIMYSEYSDQKKNVQESQLLTNLHNLISELGKWNTGTTIQSIQITIPENTKSAVVNQNSIKFTRTDNTYYEYVSDYNLMGSFPQMTGTYTITLIRGDQNYVYINQAANSLGVTNYTPIKASSQNIVFQVTTNKDSTCRFDGTDKNYSNMQNIMSGELLLHEYSLNISKGDNIYYVRCSGNDETMDYSYIAVITFDDPCVVKVSNNKLQEISFIPIKDSVVVNSFQNNYDLTAIINTTNCQFINNIYSALPYSECTITTYPIQSTLTTNYITINMNENKPIKTDIRYMIYPDNTNPLQVENYQQTLVGLGQQKLILKIFLKNYDVNISTLNKDFFIDFNEKTDYASYNKTFTANDYQNYVTNNIDNLSKDKIYFDSQNINPKIVSFLLIKNANIRSFNLNAKTNITIKGGGVDVLSDSKLDIILPLNFTGEKNTNDVSIFSNYKNYLCVDYCNKSMDKYIINSTNFGVVTDFSKTNATVTSTIQTPLGQKNTVYQTKMLFSTMTEIGLNVTQTIPLGTNITYYISKDCNSNFIQINQNTISSFRVDQYCLKALLTSNNSNITPIINKIEIYTKDNTNCGTTQSYCEIPVKIEASEYNLVNANITPGKEYLDASTDAGTGYNLAVIASDNTTNRLTDCDQRDDIETYQYGYDQGACHYFTAKMPHLRMLVTNYTCDPYDNKVRAKIYDTNNNLLYSTGNYYMLCNKTNPNQAILNDFDYVLKPGNTHRVCFENMWETGVYAETNEAIASSLANNVYWTKIEIKKNTTNGTTIYIPIPDYGNKNITYPIKIINWNNYSKKSDVTKTTYQEIASSWKSSPTCQSFIAKGDIKNIQLLLQAYYNPQTAYLSIKEMNGTNIATYPLWVIDNGANWVNFDINNQNLTSNKKYNLCLTGDNNYNMRWYYAGDMLPGVEADWDVNIDQTIRLYGKINRTRPSYSLSPESSQITKIKQDQVDVWSTFSNYPNNTICQTYTAKGDIKYFGVTLYRAYRYNVDWTTFDIKFFDMNNNNFGPNFTQSVSNNQGGMFYFNTFIKLNKNQKFKICVKPQTNPELSNWGTKTSNIYPDGESSVDLNYDQAYDIYFHRNIDEEYGVLAYSDLYKKEDINNNYIYDAEIGQTNTLLKYNFTHISWNLSDNLIEGEEYLIQYGLLVNFSNANITINISNNPDRLIENMTMTLTPILDRRYETGATCYYYTQRKWFGNWWSQPGYDYFDSAERYCSPPGQNGVGLVWFIKYYFKTIIPAYDVKVINTHYYAGYSSGSYQIIPKIYIGPFNLGGYVDTYSGWSWGGNLPYGFQNILNSPDYTGKSGNPGSIQLESWMQLNGAKGGSGWPQLNGVAADADMEYYSYYYPKNLSIKIENTTIFNSTNYITYVAYTSNIKDLKGNFSLYSLSKGQVLLSFDKKKDYGEPIAKHVRIMPENATINDNLYCNYIYFDPYGHNKTGEWIKWYKNGAEIIGQTTKNLSKTFFINNDKIICSVQVSNKLYIGEWRNSSEITIGTPRMYPTPTYCKDAVITSPITQIYYSNQIFISTLITQVLNLNISYPLSSIQLDQTINQGTKILYYIDRNDSNWTQTEPYIDYTYPYNITRIKTVLFTNHVNETPYIENLRILQKKSINSSFYIQNLSITGDFCNE